MAEANHANEVRRHAVGPRRRSVANGDRRHTGRRRAVLSALVALAVSFAITAAIAMAVVEGARNDLEEGFHQSADQASLAVEQEIAGYFAGLRGAGAFAVNAPDADSADFSAYVDESRLFDRLPALNGVFYLDRVEEADLPAFVEAASARDPNFSYFPIGQVPAGAAHYILTYYEPGATDLALPIGADVTPIAVIPQLVEAAAAADEGVAASFQDDPLLQRIAADTDFPLIQRLVELDFFIGVPTYAIGPDGTKGDVVGWVGAPMANFDQVLTAASVGQPEELGLGLTVDLTDVGLGGREDLSRAAVQEGTAGPREEGAYSRDYPFTVDGVDYKLAVWSTPDADTLPATVTVVLVGGVVLSLLAGAVVYLRVRARSRERTFAAELADQARFRRDIVDSVTTPMVVLDGDGLVVATNPAWAELRGRSADPDDVEDVGAGYPDVLEPVLRAGRTELYAALDRVLDGEAAHSEVDVAVDRGSARSWYAVRATPLTGGGGAVVVHTDVTDRKRSQDELAFKASRDDLTGLLNRPAFEDELQTALTRARAAASSVGLLFIDLDDFKAVNDTHGHAVGDEVLRAVARGITAVVRTTDRVARLGGDEFVVLIAPMAESAVPAATAERVLERLRTPVRVGELAIDLGASVGIAVVDAPLDVAGDELLHRADQAMYRAKQRGGARYESAP